MFNSTVGKVMNRANVLNHFHNNKAELFRTLSREHPTVYSPT